MADFYVKTTKWVTLLGGGAVGQNDLRDALKLAPILVAADGGADTALAQGRLPDAVIGDFDSLSEHARATIPADRQHPISEQDSTDFDKCLRTISAPMILGVGFLGPRLDHQLATLNALVRRADLRCILLGAEEIAFVCPRSLALSPPLGTRVSLFPMGDVAATSEGLKYPLEGIDFAPDGLIGTSNETSAATVEIRVSAARMIAILPRGLLRQVVQAMGPGSG